MTHIATLLLGSPFGVSPFQRCCLHSLKDPFQGREVLVVDSCRSGLFFQRSHLVGDGAGMVDPIRCSFLRCHYLAPRASNSEISSSKDGSPTIFANRVFLSGISMSSQVKA